MDYKEAVEQFKELYGDNLPLRHNGKTDLIAVNVLWGVFIDNLCREDKITPKDYRSWPDPGQEGEL